MMTVTWTVSQVSPFSLKVASVRMFYHTSMTESRTLSRLLTEPSHQPFLQLNAKVHELYNAGEMDVKVYLPSVHLK